MDIGPLLRVISWSLPHETQPHRSKINDILIRREPKFYRTRGFQNWREYADAAAAEGLVEMGDDAAGGQWIMLTRRGLSRVPRG